MQTTTFFSKILLVEAFFCDDRKQRQKAGFCNSKRRREKCEGPIIESDQKKERKNWRFEHAKDQKRKLEVDDVALCIEAADFFFEVSGTQILKELGSSWSSLTAGSSGLKLEQFDCRKFRP